MSATDSVLSVRDLVKVYKRGLFKSGFRALDSVTLEVGRGAVFGLLGPNGAGKTTLIKVLLGLCRRYKGEAKLFGMRAGAAAARKRVGYLPEAHRMPQYLTGRQVLLLYGMHSGRPRKWLLERIDGWLERVDILDAAGRKVREYSKGMQQRLGLAQALIHEPELVFLDEPTDGVDPVGRAAIREIVSELRGKGVTVFINSHLLMEVEQICDRVVIMQEGAILREGTIEELTPRTGAVTFELAEVPGDLVEILAGVGEDVRPTDDGFEAVLVDEQQDLAIDRLRARGVRIRAIRPHQMTLEQSFIASVAGPNGGGA